MAKKAPSRTQSTTTPSREKKLTTAQLVKRKLERNAEAAKAYRTRQKKTGFSVLRVWVPDELKQELIDLVQDKIDEHFANQDE